MYVHTTVVLKELIISAINYIFITSHLTVTPYHTHHQLDPVQALLC